MNIIFKRYFNEKDKRLINFFEFQTFLKRGGGVEKDASKNALFLKPTYCFLMCARAQMLVFGAKLLVSICFRSAMIKNLFGDVKIDELWRLIFSEKARAHFCTDFFRRVKFFVPPTPYLHYLIGESFLQKFDQICAVNILIVITKRTKAYFVLGVMFEKSPDLKSIFCENCKQCSWK